jgi:2-phosphoglycolate phosphatase
MSTKPTILFDLDGTLLDTATEFLHCLNIMLTESNQPLIKLESIRHHVSNGSGAMIKAAFNINETHLEFSNKKEYFLDLYEKHLGMHAKLFDGVTEFLDFLDSQKIDWAIVTNKPSRFAIPALKKLGLYNRAKLVVCADHVKEPKPSATPLLYACEKLKVAPSDCWYIGDAHIDVKASKAACIPVAIAEYGYFSENEDIQTWNADYYFSHPTDLITYFK